MAGKLKTSGISVIIYVLVYVLAFMVNSTVLAATADGAGTLLLTAAALPSGQVGSASGRAVEGFTVLQDISFEAGTPNPFWAEASTTFGSPICDVGCGPTNGVAGPLNGQHWLWFGRTGDTNETAYVRQSFILDDVNNMIYELDFWLWNSPANAGNDALSVRVDGSEIARIAENDPCCLDRYEPFFIDMNQYADGAMHVLELRFEERDGLVSSISVDDIDISIGIIDHFPLHIPSLQTPGRWALVLLIFSLGWFALSVRQRA